MLLMLRERNLMVAVEDLQGLFNPYDDRVMGRLQWGEEEQDPEPFRKQDMCFLSGEDLPRCWLDVHYRDLDVFKHQSQPVEGAASPYYGA